MPNKTAKNNFSAGVGRRKTASAQIRIISGTGQYQVSGQAQAMPAQVATILDLIGKSKSLDVSVFVRGGGTTGQRDAIILGVARALVDLNPDFRSALRKAGYLTRDPRITERKKPGLKKARRAPQWAKR